MLQNYLQDAISMLSELHFVILGITVHYLAVVFILFFVVMILIFRRNLTWRKGLAWVVILCMWMIGQEISDYYLDVPFYHLQHNWHYFAYGIFAFLANQVYRSKYTKHADIILRIFLTALFISTFDEIAQVFISTRIFDISDIAKDLWGVLMGIIFLNFIKENPANFLSGGIRIREKRLKDYLHSPVALLIWLSIFALLLLFVSSSLSDPGYAGQVVLITFVLFLILFLIVHHTKKKGSKIALSIVIVVIIGSFAISLCGKPDKYIKHLRSGMLFYKSVPLPYFDYIIFENGSFRVVDKKEFFNQTDIRFLFKKASNILLIGSGTEPKTRMGFPEAVESQFIYNPETGRGLQVIILPNEQACKVYNRLKSESKEVVFLIHQD